MCGSLYRDLMIWQKRVELTKDVFKIAELLPKTEETERVGSPPKDFAHLVTMSVASLAEAEVLRTICEELNFLRDIDNDYQDIGIVGKIINTFKSKWQIRGAI